MTDVNVIVARNILAQMKAHKTKQTELADAIGVTKQAMSKMLNGTRLISIAELQRIAAYLFFARPFRRKLQSIFGGCCSSILEVVAADPSRM